MSKQRQQPEAENEPTAQALYQQSMGLINEAIASCGIEGFSPAPLAIPQMISQDSFNAGQIQQPSQNAFFRQAQSLYGEQGALFGEQEALYVEPEPEPQPEPQADSSAHSEHPGQAAQPEFVEQAMPESQREKTRQQRTKDVDQTSHSSPSTVP